MGAARFFALTLILLAVVSTINHADLDRDPGRGLLGERMTVWKIVAIVPDFRVVVIVPPPASQSASRSRSRRSLRISIHGGR
jgi:hypothetical protein